MELLLFLKLRNIVFMHLCTANFETHSHPSALFIILLMCSCIQPNFNCLSTSNKLCSVVCILFVAGFLFSLYSF
jgi:hypothetical protein